jgi:hypothetical protein
MRRSAQCLELLLLLALVGGCTQEGAIGRVREQTILDPQKLDVLFVVDNSDSMREEQALYLPLLIRQLASLPGGLPSLHVGVVSTDLGAGGHAAEACAHQGDGGALQDAPRVAGCTPPAGAFIADEIAGDRRQRNYSGSLEDAFMCIAPLGIAGCGLEQPLAAMRRALDGSASKNAGFLRDDAFLAVIILTDEDDCSAAQPELLFDPAPALDDPQGPLGAFSSFRCTRFGLDCDGGPPAAPGEHTGCAPRDASYVHHTDAFVEFLTGLKDPAGLLVSVVAGARAPVRVVATPSGAAARALVRERHGHRRSRGAARALRRELPAPRGELDL